MRSDLRLWAGALAMVVVAVVAPKASAVNPANWNFSVTTTGSDATWLSPTNVDTGFPQYDVTFNVTTLDVGTVVGTIDMIALGLIAPADLTGADSFFSGLPISIFSNSVNQDGNTADIEVGIEATGQGFASMTNVALGTINLPIFGNVQVTSITAAGDVSATGVVPEPATLGLLGVGGTMLLLRRRQRTGG